MQTSPFNRMLIAPGREELHQALCDAAAWTGRSARKNLVTFDPADADALLDECTRAGEGFRQWNGGPALLRAGGARSAVAVAWWSDPIGRCHARVSGGRGRLGLAICHNLLCPNDPTRPPLWLVYPEHVFLRHRDGVRSLWVCCGCGVSGTPESVGWMGKCCAACHDRVEEGRPAAEANSMQRTLPGGYRIDSLAFAPSGRFLAVASSATAVRLWDLDKGLHEDLGLTAGSEPLLVFSPQGESLVFGPARVRSRVWVIRYDLGSGTSHALGECILRDLSIAPAGRFLAVTTLFGVELFDTDSWRPVRMIPYRGQAIHCAALSFDGRTLAVGSSDRTIVVWDLVQGREAGILRDLWGWPTCLTFAPTGALLAVGMVPYPFDAAAPEQGRIILREGSSGPFTTLPGLPGAVEQLAFSPDGRTLAILAPGPDPRKVHSRWVLLWDVAAGREREALEWHGQRVRSLAFSPDGEWLATGADDGLVRLWPWRRLSGAAAGWPTAGARRAGPL